MGILRRFSVENKVALVTGGASGIGESFVFALAEAGANVAVADVNFARASHVCRQVGQMGIQSIALQVDVTKRDQVCATVDSVLAKWGRLDIGVNNAGIAIRAPAEEMTEDGWDATLNVDLKGVFLCCQIEALAMLPLGRGSIVNTASMSAQIANRPQLHVAYNAAKAGVVQLTRTCAAEWAARGVRVNCLSPGHTLSPMTARRLDEQDGEFWRSNTPMNRIGLPQDLQGGLIFLASSASSYVTGHDLVIDGGYTLW